MAEINRHSSGGFLLSGTFRRFELVGCVGNTTPLWREYLQRFHRDVFGIRRFALPKK